MAGEIIGTISAVQPGSNEVLSFNLAAGTGSRFYVGSAVTGATDSTGFGKSPSAPFATLDYAVGQCTADKGDIIYVLPGHTETVTAAAGLDLDTAGITIVGMGTGSKRPTIALTTATTADIDVDAADITIENFIIDLTGVDEIAAGIDVNAAYFTMRKCRVVMSDSAGQAVLGLVGAAAADNLTIEDCQFVGSSDAGPTAAIQLEAQDETTIRRCTFTGDYSAAPIDFNGAATNVLIEHCDLNNLNAVDVCIEGLANSTGTIRHNTCRIATDGQTTWINTAGNMQLYENYGVNNNGETGKLIGTASV